jgi:hypothetical protein
MRYTTSIKVLNACLVLFLWLASAALARAATPAVKVTLNSDATTLKVGDSTTIHVFAQIAPEHQADTDQIFSWYVDLLDSNGAAFQITAATLNVATSDKDTATSSKGAVSGANLRGIYDTFLKTPGAGHDAPIELFSVSVKALAPGNATLSVAAGSGVANLSSDFVVSSSNGGDPLTGGNYAQATAALTGFNNTAPTIDPIAPSSIDEGKKLTLTAVGHDIDAGQKLTYTLSGLKPGGASVDPNTGVFTWIPAESHGPRTYVLAITVADNASPPLSATVNFSVTVNEVNTPPTLQVPANQTIAELTPLNLACVATDTDILAAQVPNTNKITFALVDAPAGATINPTTGAFSWTPTEAQGPGTYPINVSATDDGSPALSVTKSFTVTVTEVNQAPVLTAPKDQTIPELSTLNVAFVGVDPDLPPNPLIFTLLSGPPGLVLDPATGVITWTPTEAQGPGSYTVTAKVSDGPLSATNTLHITVSEVNARPVLGALQNQTVNELSPLALTATATDTDLPKNTLTFSLDSAPTGMSINAASGVLTWTPTEAQGPGVYTVAVRVTDNGSPAQSDTKSFDVTVAEANSAPVLKVPANQTVNELATLIVTNSATDIDLPANTLTFSLVTPPDGVALDPVTGVLIWTPAEAQGPGTYTITVKVTDNGAPALSATGSFQVTVAEINSPPVFASIADKTVSELVPLVVPTPATDSDLPPNKLTYSLLTPPPGAIIDANTGVFTWTPSEAQGPGTYNISVRVVDNGTPALSATNKFTVTVQEINLPPALIVPSDQTIPELSTLTVTNKATDPDLPVQSLIFSLVTGPDGVALNTQTGVLTWTPTEAQGPGKYPVTIKVTDNGNPSLSATKTFNITVSEVNTAPVLQGISAQAITELSTLTLTAKATDADLPANKLTFSLTASPPGAAIDPATGIFSWTPTEAQGPGTYNVTVKVTDDASPPASDNKTFSVSVLETNSPPVLIVPANQTVAESSTITVTNKATDADLPAQSLTFSLLAAPVGVSLQPQTGVLSWTPQPGFASGLYTMTVKVTDNGSPAMSDTKSFSIAVTKGVGGNSPPVLTLPADQTVAQGGTLSIGATATDPDIPAQTLTFSLVTPPTGVAINAQTGLITWTPAQTPGKYTITVKVTDNGTPALSATGSFNVTLTPSSANTAPILTAPLDQTITQGATLSVTATATDADVPAQTLTFGLVAPPVGPAINPQTGVITWVVPATQAPGPYQITVKVTDNGSPAQSISKVFTVTVKTSTGGTAPRLKVDTTSPGVGGFKITVIGDPRADYTLEFSDDLKQWSPLTTVNLGAATSIIYTDTTSVGKSKRFYRAKGSGTVATPAAKVGPLSVTSTAFTLRVTGQTRAKYNIESSEDLKAWTPAGSVTLGDTTTADFTDSAISGKKMRFYRANSAP